MMSQWLSVSGQAGDADGECGGMLPAWWWSVVECCVKCGSCDCGGVADYLAECLTSAWWCSMAWPASVSDVACLRWRAADVQERGTDVVAQERETTVCGAGGGLPI
ncbi:hypothetical protein E2C01_008385 [Portunus trituberculatus]|uniref:Uncharacterized protein n=1 Tax=Portunus trituberculatus TaxID=210409 RepID=A0A5B7D0P0_PORTR|nr:hypothetical protein [Portunus trituberculatus]